MRFIFTVILLCSPYVNLFGQREHYTPEAIKIRKDQEQIGHKIMALLEKNKADSVLLLYVNVINKDSLKKIKSRLISASKDIQKFKNKYPLSVMTNFPDNKTNQITCRYYNKESFLDYYEVDVFFDAFTKTFKAFQIETHDEKYLYKWWKIRMSDQTPPPPPPPGK